MVKQGIPWESPMNNENKTLGSAAKNNDDSKQTYFFFALVKFKDNCSIFFGCLKYFSNGNKSTFL